MVAAEASPEQGERFRPSALAASPPQPVCFIRNAAEGNALANLESVYAKTVQAVEQRLPLYGRGLQVRVCRGT